MKCDCRQYKNLGRCLHIDLDPAENLNNNFVKHWLERRLAEERKLAESFRPPPEGRNSESEVERHWFHQNQEISVQHEGRAEAFEEALEWWFK